LHIAARQRSSINESEKFKRHVKSRNKRHNKPKPKAVKKKLEYYFKDFKKVSAPRQFSLIKNAEQVIRFIQTLKSFFDQKKKVFVIMKYVTTIDYDAIVVLLSMMIKFKSNRIEFNGDFPDNPICNEILLKSGFFNFLHKRYIENSDRYNIGKNVSIHTHAWKMVDSTLGEKLISQAANKIWKQNRRCQGVQRTLIELMMNTNNHATIGIEGDKHWWLSVHYDNKENKAAFCFVDFGVGVFESLEHKPAGSKFFGWFDKLKSFFTFSNNAELLKLILDGDLHKTVTGKPYRGKGLPGIKEALQRNQVSNLYIITNNVWANVKDENYKIISDNFEGTFIYFELNENNISCYGNN